MQFASKIHLFRKETRQFRIFISISRALGCCEAPTAPRSSSPRDAPNSARDGDVNPIGRIINRYAQDVAVVDLELQGRSQV